MPTDLSQLEPLVLGVFPRRFFVHTPCIIAGHAIWLAARDCFGRMLKRMSSKTLVPCKSRFDTGNGVAYLDTATEGLPLKDSGKALAKYFVDKCSGSPGRSRMFQQENETLQAVATLLGTSERNVALTGNATDA